MKSVYAEQNTLRRLGLDGLQWSSETLDLAKASNWHAVPIEFVIFVIATLTIA